MFQFYLEEKGKTDQSKFAQSVFQATIVSPDQRALQLLLKIRLRHRQVGEKKLQSWLRQRGKVATSRVVAGKVAGGGGCRRGRGWRSGWAVEGGQEGKRI